MKKFKLILISLSLLSTSMAYSATEFSHGEPTRYGSCSCAYFNKDNYKLLEKKTKFLFIKYLRKSYDCSYVCHDSNGIPSLVKAQHIDEEPVKGANGSNMVCDGITYKYTTRTVRTNAGYYDEVSMYDVKEKYAFHPRTSRVQGLKKWSKANCQGSQIGGSSFIPTGEIEAIGRKLWEESRN